MIFLEKGAKLGREIGAAAARLAGAKVGLKVAPLLAYSLAQLLASFLPSLFAGAGEWGLWSKMGLMMKYGAANGLATGIAICC